LTDNSITEAHNCKCIGKCVVPHVERGWVVCRAKKDIWWPVP